MTRITPVLLPFQHRKDELQMRSRKTHYEQVPVEVVKKIIAQEKLLGKRESDNVDLQTPSSKTEPYSVQVNSLMDFMNNESR